MNIPSTISQFNREQRDVERRGQERISGVAMQPRLPGTGTTNRISLATEAYREHVVICRVCGAPGCQRLCLEGQRLASEIGNAQGALILGGIAKPKGGVQ